MPTNFTNAVSAICCKAVAVTLPTIADSDDTLAVPIPGDVIDAARNDRIFPLGVDGFDGIPYTDLARYVTRRDPEPRRGESCNGCGSGMAGILLAECWVVDTA